MPSWRREQVTQHNRLQYSNASHVKIHSWVLCFLLTGYGGGFNERENVEYIEREESDGEYDEVTTFALHRLLISL